MSKLGMKICNPEESSKIVYVKPLKETFEIATGDTEATKFYDVEIDYIELTSDIKNKIWDAMAHARSEARMPPFIILVPKSWVSRKRVPYEETPIPFADSDLYLIPYINRIMVLDKWDERDDE